MTTYQILLPGGYLGRIEGVPARTGGAAYWRVICPCNPGLDQRVPMVGNRRPTAAYNLLNEHAEQNHPGVPEGGQPPPLPEADAQLSAVVARDVFTRLVAEVTDGGLVWVGAWGFAGTPSHLARFILIAQATLGDYDAQMLAVVVQATDHPAATRPGWHVYRFPGLDLY